MVSAFYILHAENMDLAYSSSQILLQRVFYDTVPDARIVIDNFDAIYKAQKPHERTPVIHYGGLNYIYIRQENDILLLVVTRSNTDVMSMVLFLHNFQDLMKFYLCKKDKQQQAPPFDKDTVTDNVYFIYELLDECMDLGVIQMTDYNILKEYIKVIPNRPDFHLTTGEYSDSDDEDDNGGSDKSKSGGKGKNKKMSQKEINKVKSTHNQAIKADEIAVEESHINSSILRASSSAINWRPKGIFYAKNEIFIDLIENCEFYYDLEKGVILQNEVFGTCFVKCYLSGMPTCILGFNEDRISKIQRDGAVESVRRDNQLGEVEVEEQEEEEAQEETETAASSRVVPRAKKHIPFRNIQFHQCVQLDSIYNDNLMKFIPPDDKFILMSYHVEQQYQKRKLPLIMIKPTYRVQKAAQKLQVLCILSTQFKRRLHCKNIQVRIPINPVLFEVVVDKDHDLKYKTEMGDVRFQVDSSELVWTLDDVTGNNPSIKMMAEVQLSGVGNITMDSISQTLVQNNKIIQEEPEFDDGEEARQELDRYYGVNGTKSSVVAEIQKKLRQVKSFNHVKISFNVPMLSYTGLKLNYLKVEETDLKYTCFPWVRYVTQSDRINSALFGSASKSSCSYRFKLGASCFDVK